MAKRLNELAPGIHMHLVIVNHARYVSGSHRWNIHITISSAMKRASLYLFRKIYYFSYAETEKKTTRAPP